MRAFLFGLLLALLGVGHRYPSPLRGSAAPGAPAWWIADRSANRLWVLDGELLPLTWLGLRAPVAVLPEPEGGVWVAQALEGRPLGPHSLRRIGSDGQVGRALRIPPLADLVATAQGPVVLTRGGTVLGLKGGRLWPLLHLPGARAIVAQGAHVFSCDEAGQVLRLDLGSGRVTTLAVVWPAPVDLAPGRAGGVWLIDADGALRSVDRFGRVSDHGPLGLSQPRFARGARPGALWVFDRERADLWLGSRGDSVRRVRLEGGAAGIEAALVTADGGLLALAPGSVQRLDGRGRCLWAQGGFEFAVSAGPAAGCGPRSGSSRRESGG